MAIGMQKPVMFYRKDRDDWRAVWELYPQDTGIVVFPGYLWTVEGSIEAWCDVARGMMPKSGKVPISYQEGEK
jgi:hypothetical protein